MPTKMTIEAAIIELNRLKSQERMDIDRERLSAAVDKLTEAGRFRIKRKPMKQKYEDTRVHWTDYKCAQCSTIVTDFQLFCDVCGQAIDWSN